MDVPPSGVGHYPGHKAPDYDLTPAAIDAIINRGPVVRAQDNLDAIKLVKLLAKEQRYATDDEQHVLAKYVGWGASDMANRLADYPDRSWSANERKIWDELNEVLTAEERQSLSASTPYAHFTYKLFGPMWDALVHAGFTGGRVLEPSVGTGHAFGFMPPELRKESTLNGVEIEPITAAIAHHLYPSARIQPVGYEQARLARGTQDIVLGNPPFGDWGVQDRRMPDVATERIHNYFFAKALEHLRPGGILMFVATHYAMDSTKAASLRRYLMEKADFVGAVRLPDAAFKKSAKTEVVTDIIVLRKLREGEKAKNADLFIQSPVNDTLSTRDYRGKPINVYRSKWYDEHPDLVLGTESNSGTMYGGGGYNVEPHEDTDLLADLRSALTSILPAGAYEPQTEAEPGRPTKTPVVVEGQFKPGELRVGEKGTIVKVDADGVQHDVTPRKRDGTVDGKSVTALAGMIAIRDARNAAITVMRDRSASNSQVQHAQQQLSHVYDKFVKPKSAEPNYLNNTVNKRLFRDDPEAANLLALEKVEAKAKLTVSPKDGKQTLRLSYHVIGKADIFTKRTVGADPDISHVETPRDALYASLGIKSKIDWPYMAGLHGGSVAALQDALKTEGLVYEQPDGSYALADEYLSGDVVSKLEDVENADDPTRFGKNLEALKAIQPPAKTKDDVMAGMVSIGLGSNWVPKQDLANFVAEQLDVNSRGVKFNVTGTSTLIRWTGEYSDQAKQAAARHQLIVKYDSSHKTYDFLDLLDDTLNLKRPRLGHWEGTGDNRYWVKEPAAELAAAGNQELLRQAWDTYVLQHEDVLGRLLGIFNTRFNRTIERKYDGSHMQYPGMAQLTNAKGELITFFPHQNNGVWRILTSGNTLLAHEVGAGKTFEMIAAAMEMRRTGRATKPMITVPTYLLSQWRQAIVSLYPTAKLAAFDEKDLIGAKRQQAMARIAHGDWDIVLVPHSSFGLLKVSNERMVQQYHEWISELEGAIDGADKMSKKEFEKQKKRIEDKVAKKMESLEDEKKDNSLTWEQLGVDALMVDEAHAFKNLFFFTKLDNMRGLSRSESDRALDLFVKVKDINEQSHYRNVVLATATPVMNGIAEVFTMQRYLQPQALREMGADNFDAWYAMFAKAMPTTERQPDGSYKEVMRLKDYSNLQLLSKTMREVMDYVGWEDMPYLKLPTYKINIVETPKHPMYPVMQKWFEERMQALKDTPPHVNQHTGEYVAPERLDPLTGDPMGRKDNILSVMTDAKKAAVDLRLILGARATDFKDSRIQKAADLMYDYWKRTKDKKGVGLMFLDMGTPPNPSPLTFLAGVTSLDDTGGDTEEKSLEDAEEATNDDDDVDAFNLYDDLKAALIKRGVPAHEIAYIHQAKNAAERLALFDAANEGKVRFVFASTDKGGVGMNIQTRLGAVFELDAPRAQRPGDLRQRMGRAVRQGNLFMDWGGVEMYRFVTKDTTDEWLWGLLNTKDYQLRKFYRGEASAISEEDPSTMSLQEAQIRASGDPRAIELTELKGKMARLEAQAMAGELAVSSAKATIARETPYKAAVEKDLAELRAWIPHYTKLRGESFTMKVGAETYGKNGDANDAIVAALKKLLPAKPARETKYSSTQAPIIEIGSIGGIRVLAQDASYMDRVQVNKTTVVAPVWAVTVFLDGTPAGLGTIPAADASYHEKEQFGDGRNFATSVLHAYESIPDNEAKYAGRIQDAADAISQSQRVLDNPPQSVAALVRARARVKQIETELTAETEAKEKARAEAKVDLQRKANTVHEQRPIEPMEEPPSDKELATTASALRKSRVSILTVLGNGPTEKELVQHGMRTWRQRLSELTQRATHADFALKKAQALFDRLAAGAKGDPADRRVQAVRQRILAISDYLEGQTDTFPADVFPSQDAMDVFREWREIREALFELEKAKQDDLGVGLAWQDYYLGHIWDQGDQKDGTLKRMLNWMLGGKRPIEGPKTYRKTRTIPTMREGVEISGKEPETWNLVDIDLAKLMEMRKFTAAATWLNRDLKPSGAARFVSALGKPPKNLYALPGKFFEVWAPPHVEVREAFDLALMHGLESLLDTLGVDYKRVPDSRRAWGTTEINPDTDEITVQAKFGGPVDTLMHELGHALDERYKLSELFPIAEYGEELARLASLRHEQRQASTEFREYVQTRDEQMANMIHAYLYVPERMKQEAPGVYARLEGWVGSVPQLAEALPDLQATRSLVLGERSTKKRLAGPVLVGRYYAPRPLAKAAERYLQPGLGAHAAWRLLRWPTNALVQWTLAWPLFHFYTVTKAAMADEFAQGLQSLMAGHPVRGVQQIVQSPFGPLLAGIEGQKHLDLYRDSPDVMGAAMLDMTKALVMGGARPMGSPEYKNHAIRTMLRGFREAHGAWEAGLPKTAAGAALKGAFALVPATLEAVAWTIMDKYVPLIKTGSTARGIATDLMNLPGLPTEETLRAIATKRVNQADALYGQVIWDNMALLIPRAVMNGIQFLIMAPGWRGGALVTALRGFGDPIWRLRKENREKYTLAGAGGAGGGAGKPPKGKGRGAGKEPLGEDGLPPYVHEPWFSSYLALMIGIAVIGTAWAELWQMAHGAGPVQSAKDVAAPRDGTTDDDGKPHRDRFPGYEAIFYEILRHPPFSVLQYTLGGESPLPLVLSEWYHNETPLGGAIWDPGDPFGDQFADYAKYLAKRIGKPIVVTSYERAETPEQEKRALFYASSPASKAVTDTPAEALMRHYAPPPKMSEEDLELARLKRQVRHGDPAQVDAAIESGKLTEQQILRALRSGAEGTTAMQAKFRSLPFDKALKVYEVATPEERGIWQPILLQRAEKDITAAPPSQIDGLLEMFNTAMELPVK